MTKFRSFFAKRSGRIHRCLFRHQLLLAIEATMAAIVHKMTLILPIVITLEFNTEHAMRYQCIFSHI